MKFPTRLNQIISSVSASSWLPEALAGVAGILYFVQSVWFAHNQWSVLDEGNYAYKGWLFVTGQYVPYQAYGFWTNHMPLSFLFFGYIQLLFGPGIRTIRYFAVFLGCLFLLGMWFASRRLTGRWIAVVGIWVLALNPFEISDYSVGITQVIIGCLLVWMLYFTLGRGRSARELIAGAVLLAIMILTRENLILIAPFVFAYIFLEHGRRNGFIAAGVTIIIVLVVHLIYWPGIMTVWGRWIPKILYPYFSSWVYQGGGTFAWSPPASLSNSIRVVFASIRLNFIAIFGAAAIWLAWPKDGLKDRSQFRSIVLLTVMFVVLYLAHAWASFGKDYCPDCLINYVSFFFPIGLLLFLAFLAMIKDHRPALSAWPVACLILLLTAGMAYSNYENTGQALTSLSIPRMNNFSFQPGSVELWRFLANKFGLSFQFLIRFLPTAFGFLAGALIVIVGLAISRWMKKDSVLSSPVQALILVALCVGLILSPTVLLSGLDTPGACPQDVITSYEKVGAELAQRIPPGSRVFWRGDASPVPLLYVPNIKIYPPQMNQIYSFVVHGDTDQTLRFGFWNDELAQKWLAEADIVLIRSGDYMGMKSQISPAVFKELETTAPTSPCNPDSSIRIFKRQ